MLLNALLNYNNLRILQDDVAGVVTFAEEAYDCVAVAYNPVHPQVQEAANTLIESLTCKGDLSKAEVYAQMTLESLKDPANKVDQGGEVVARGHYNLGRIIFDQKGDLVRAEKLAREKIRIKVHLCGNDHSNVRMSIGLLAVILSSQGKLGDEVKEMYERVLSILLRPEGQTREILLSGIQN